MHPVSPIPIVDFGKFLHGNEQEKEDVARQLDAAFREVGFVYLRNHGVPRERVEECFAWSKKFFDLPLETKMLAPHPPGGSHHRGYSAMGVEKVSQHAYDEGELARLRETPDPKQSFETGHPTDPLQPNIWPPPSTLPGFQPSLETFFTTCTTLTHALLTALSLALHLPFPGLSPTHSNSHFQLRLLHYPSIPAAQLQRGAASRISAHSDFGSLTLLFQDRVGGLEIEDPKNAGVFRAAVPVEDSVLVNIGDLMARWSNERWRSTVHRVGLPAGFNPTSGSEGDVDAEGGKMVLAPGADTGGQRDMLPERYSIPFFAAPNLDTVIDALPGCWDAQNPKKYEPVTAGEYVQMRMAALYEG